MPEYINRDYLLAEYDRQHQGPPGGARKIIAEAPAADVVERKRGHWIKERWGTEKVRRCSACGVTQTVTVSMGKVMYRYCPYCGAKMFAGDKNAPTKDGGQDDV